MDFQIDVKTLIDAVKKRTSLYDRTKKEYSDRKLKKILWKEVCQEVCTPSVWDSLSSQDRNRYGREAQKRWCSLRHCFRRELVAQKTAPPGGSVKKRKYMYFDSLLFLLPFTETVKTRRVSIEINDTDTGNLENTTQTPIQNDLKADPSSSEPGTPTQNNNDEEVMTLLNEGHQMHHNFETYDYGQDDDDLFFRSLIPYMKDFQGNRKLLLRMEIMKLILNFRQSSNDNEGK